MNSPYQQIKAKLIWEPLLHGLEVHEPKTVLEVNLGWHAWERAVAAQDDLAAYATKHMEELK